MNATPRPHFEEIDWFDYVRGDLDRPLAQELGAHLHGCEGCRGLVRDYERLARAVPASIHLVSAHSAPEKEGRDAAVLAAATESARQATDPSDALRREIQTAFAGDGAGPAWSPTLVEEANVLCRELLRTDVPLAGRILRSALAQPGLGRGLSASLSSTLAYVLRMEGRLAEALALLDGARADLESGAAIPEIELGFWHYVRASIFYPMRRLEEALAEIRVARGIYEMLEDGDRIVRCGQVEAIVLSDLGRRDEALALYRRLIDDPLAGESRAARALLLMNYGGELGLARRFAEARSVYARAIDLLAKTGQTQYLMRVREGLSKIAVQENRLEEALAMKISLRPDFKALSILWEEVILELEIAELYLKLGRSSEAASVCRAILPNLEGASLPQEAAKALAYLVEAEREIDVERLGRVRQFFRRLENSEDVQWSAA